MLIQPQVPYHCDGNNQVNKGAYKEGDIVDIATYRNDKKNDCIIIGNEYNKKGVFFIIIGTVFIIIALILLFIDSGI